MGEEDRFQDKIVTFRYAFTFKDKAEKEFTINLDAKTLNCIATKKKSCPLLD